MNYMVIKKEIIEDLSKLLNLQFTGIEQDWDIEMADVSKIEDFICFYNKKNLSNELKVGTMALILASFEEFLNENDLNIDDRWNEIKFILETEKNLFHDLIKYWSLSDEVEEFDAFRITPLIRTIK